MSFTLYHYFIVIIQKSLQNQIIFLTKLCLMNSVNIFILSLLFSCSIFFVQCKGSLTGEPGYARSPIRFVTNDPDNNDGGSLEYTLLELIDSSQKTILASINNLTREPIVEALTRARMRGVEIKIMAPESRRQSKGLREMERICLEMSCDDDLEGDLCRQKMACKEDPSSPICALPVQCPWIIYPGIFSDFGPDNYFISDYHDESKNTRLWLSQASLTNEAMLEEGSIGLVIHGREIVSKLVRKFEQIFFSPDRYREVFNELTSFHVLGNHELGIFLSPADLPIREIGKELNGARQSIRFLSHDFFYHRNLDYDSSLAYLINTLEDKIEDSIRVRGVTDLTSLDGHAFTGSIAMASNLFRNGAKKDILNANLILIDEFTERARAIFTTFSWQKEIDKNIHGTMIIFYSGEMVKKLSKFADSIFSRSEIPVPLNFYEDPRSELIISEVNLTGSCKLDYPWIELYVTGGEGNIQNLFLSDLDGTEIPFTGSMANVKSTETILIHYMKSKSGELPESEYGFSLEEGDRNQNGAWDFYFAGIRPSMTDDQVVLTTAREAELLEPGNSKVIHREEIFDALVFGDPDDGKIVANEVSDILLLGTRNSWLLRDLSGQEIDLPGGEDYYYPAEIFSAAIVPFYKNTLKRKIILNQYQDTNRASDWESINELDSTPGEMNSATPRCQ